MKRIYYVILFFALSAVLLIFLILYPKDRAERQKILDSTRLAEEIGECVVLDSRTIVSVYAYHGKCAFMDNFEKIITFADKTELDTFVAIPPRKMDVFFEELALPQALSSKALFELAESASQGHLKYVDLLGLYQEEYDRPVYFLTDHHWTSFGAYLAYRELISAMGEVPFDEEYFERETAHTQYRGSDYNKIKSDLYLHYDTIELYHSKKAFTVCDVKFPYDSDENNVVTEDIYKREHLKYKDPYLVYFGGNAPYITIRTQEARPTLLVIRDSFASALAPFLAEHFDLVLLDTRFYPDGVKGVIEREGVDKILILQNMGSYTENTIKLRY